MTTSFIEKQFPVSKVSKESYKERKAVQSQTLTGFGKWWGRKPLILVRATILGCLLPATNNPEKDMDIFLKLMSMDEDSLLLRKEKKIAVADLYDIIQTNKVLQSKYGEMFDLSSGKPKLKKEASKDEIEAAAFGTLGYDERITMCKRPEQLENISEQAWREINHHLGTDAHSLNELVNQLSLKRYGHNVIVGDCFCGGGSIPFEAARMGCDTYGSDLNPVAGLLTWADINICGSDDIKGLNAFLKETYEQVKTYIDSLGIEENDAGEKAFGYLYCLETECPECGWTVPMLPTLVVGVRAGGYAARLKENNGSFDISIYKASRDELRKIENDRTIRDHSLYCPHCGKSTPIPVIRHDVMSSGGSIISGIRHWQQTEFTNSVDDVFKERLYAIRYERSDGSRYYCAPSKRDLENEDKINRIVENNINHWQENGYIPTGAIEPGEKTEEIRRTRGWTCWHQLFTPRQLLILSKLVELIMTADSKQKQVAGILAVNRVADYSTKLCRWDPNTDISKQTYYNQALNTLYNWGARSFWMLNKIWMGTINPTPIRSNTVIQLADARNVDLRCDFWITDPPYADAVNYHELSEFFLSIDKFLIKNTFPEWYTDSKRILAVRGDDNFSRTMIDIYSNLTGHMNDDGMQVVMFTHSDPAVWAQLALIMWKSGLTVTAAWNIATETDASGLKDGNYVKGTVLLVLRKQKGEDEAFLDELTSDIKREVKKQIESMQALDDKDDPNFSDPDYVLAAYAASLKVLTSYKSIGEIDLDYELDLAINDPSKSEVVKLIERAKKIAYDCIIPIDFDSFLWKELSAAERFYIKGLEAEKHGNYQISTYQEYARGFGLSNYGKMMASERANTARLKTPSELAMRSINEVPSFESSTLRTILAAVYVAIKEDEDPNKGLWHLKNSLPDYWGSRELIKQVLAYLADTKYIDKMDAWHEDARMAEHIRVLVDNDHV